MKNLRHSLIGISSSLSLPHLFSASPRSALTTLLYHRFFLPGEDVNLGRERLRRQLAWLREKYTPLPLSIAVSHIEQGTLPTFPLVVTSDDASCDLLKVWDVFQEYAMPLTIFVCTGWVENEEPLNAPATLSRVVDFIEWYRGPEQKIDLGKKSAFLLGQKSAEHAIDYVIAKSQTEGKEFLTNAWDVLRRLHREEKTDRQTCNWSELQDLHQRGATIGSHTVTHCRLAQCTDIRLNFELNESKNNIAAKVTNCEMLAYPFGTPDVSSPRTTVFAKQAGYQCATLTDIDFAPNHADVFSLPRITIPDEKVELNLFCALVRGGQIPFQRIKRIIDGNR